MTGKEYWEKFNFDGPCIEGTWRNCCDSNGKPYPCLAEGTALASAAAKPCCGCGGGNTLAVSQAIAAKWPKEDVFELIDRLKADKP